MKPEILQQICDEKWRRERGGHTADGLEGVVWVVTPEHHLHRWSVALGKVVHGVFVSFMAVGAAEDLPRLARSLERALDFFTLTTAVDGAGAAS